MDFKNGSESPHHRELGEDVASKANAAAPGLRLDKHGLPLSPQPSARKDDPLVNWPSLIQARPTFSLQAELAPGPQIGSLPPSLASGAAWANGGCIAESGFRHARPRISNNSRPGIVPAGGLPRILGRGAAVCRAFCELDWP